jgi:flavodoxin
MAKVLIVYESKYGNTRLVAEKIAEGIKQASGIEAALTEIKQADPKKMPDFDVILIGSPNHIGRPTGSIMRFISRLGRLPLEGKLVAFFDTYMARDYEKAVKRMERHITEKVPGLKVAAPGLSIRVEEMKGPIAEGELPKCVEFGVKIGTILKGLSS